MGGLESQNRMLVLLSAAVVVRREMWRANGVMGLQWQKSVTMHCTVRALSLLPGTSQYTLVVPPEDHLNSASVSDGEVPLASMA